MADVEKNTNSINQVLLETLEIKGQLNDQKNAKPAIHFDAIFEDIRTQNEATLTEIKDANIRIKRGFEDEKKHFEKHISVLQEEIVKLDSSLKDVNWTLSKTVPEIQVNLDHANTEFIRTLNSSNVESMLEFSHLLESTSKSTRTFLTDVTSSFVRIAQHFNDTLDEVEEDVKKEVRVAIQESVDKQMTSLKGSLNSKLSVLEGKVSNVDNNMANMKSSLNTKLTSVDRQLTRIIDIGSQTKHLTEDLLSHERNGYFFPQNGNTTSVRLANTTVHQQWVKGRLELFHSGKWGTVCDDSFQDSDARVACKMFRPSVSSVNVYEKAAYGQGSGPIWLDSVGCSGSESSLWSCGHAGVGDHNCGHNEDVAIRCYW